MAKDLHDFLPEECMGYLAISIPKRKFSPVTLDGIEKSEGLLVCNLSDFR